MLRDRSRHTLEPVYALPCDGSRCVRGAPAGVPWRADAPQDGDACYPSYAERRAAAILLEGEGMEAIAALEAREARPLAPVHPTEERLRGHIQSGQHVLQEVRVDGSILRQLGADGLQLRFLLKARDRDVAALPGRDALFEGDVVKRATAHQCTLQFPLQLGSRLELVFASLAHALLVHPALFCLADTTRAMGMDLWLKPRAPIRLGSKPSGLRRTKARFYHQPVYMTSGGGG